MSDQESIVVVCSCEKRLKAPIRLAGKRVACPNCGEPVVIPQRASKDRNESTGVPAQCSRDSQDYRKTVTVPNIKAEYDYVRNVRCAKCGSAVQSERLGSDTCDDGRMCDIWEFHCRRCSSQWSELLVPAESLFSGLFGPARRQQNDGSGKVVLGCVVLLLSAILVLSAIGGFVALCIWLVKVLF